MHVSHPETSRYALVETSTLREDVTDFVLREARLLDDGQFEQWLDLFAADGVYWVPAKPRQTSPDDHVSLFYDDKATLQIRIGRLRHPQIHVQTPPSRICHVVSAVTAETEPDGLVVARSSFVMLEYRPDWGERLFGGQTLHRLRRVAERFEIVLKRVDLVNCDAAFPALAIPF